MKLMPAIKNYITTLENPNLILTIFLINVIDNDVRNIICNKSIITYETGTKNHRRNIKIAIMPRYCGYSVNGAKNVELKVSNCVIKYYDSLLCRCKNWAYNDINCFSYTDEQ